MGIIIAALIMIIGILIICIVANRIDFNKLSNKYIEEGKTWMADMHEAMEEVYPCFLVLRRCPAEEHFRQEVDFSLYDKHGIIGFTVFSSEFTKEERFTFSRAAVYSICGVWIYKIDEAIGGSVYEQIEDLETNSDDIDW